MEFIVRATKTAAATAAALALLLASLAFAGATFAQDAKEPAELVKERAKYEAELQAATKRIQADHIARLKTLQRRYTQAGDLDAALAVRDALKSIPEMKETPREASTATGIPEGVAFLEGDWIYREGTATYPLHIDGNGHINWGDWYNPTAKRQGRRIDWVNDRGGLMATFSIASVDLLVEHNGKKLTGRRWERVKKEKAKPTPAAIAALEGKWILHSGNALIPCSFNAEGRMDLWQWDNPVLSKAENKFVFSTHGRLAVADGKNRIVMIDANGKPTGEWLERAPESKAETPKSEVNQSQIFAK